VGGRQQNQLTAAEILRVTFLARDVIYTSHAYATMSLSVLSLRLSVTKVHWRILANLGFKF